MNNPEKIKLVAVGDGSVGKTCILISYTTDKFPTEYIPTVFDNYVSQVNVNGKTVDLELYDTAGQETYDKLRVLSYDKTDIFIIVCSVADSSSFENVIHKWLPELSKGDLADVPKLVVGNKIDMRDANNKSHIVTDAAKSLLSQQNCQYFECSALTQEGLKEVFDEAIKTVLNKRQTGAKGAKGAKKGSETKKKHRCNIF